MLFISLLKHLVFRFSIHGNICKHNLLFTSLTTTKERKEKLVNE